MQIILIGANGKMGQEMQNFLKSQNQNFVCIDKDNITDLNKIKSGIVLDFSSSLALCQNLDFALKNNLPLVIATTNHTKQNLKKIENASKKIPIFISSNFSIMFNLMLKFTKQLSALKDCDFVLTEVHHKTKKDSPSGSAKMIIECLNENNINPQVFSVRAGKEIGKHTLTVFGSEENLTLSHIANSRQVFCRGAYSACKFVEQKQNGLFNMENLIDDCL